LTLEIFQRDINTLILLRIHTTLRFIITIRKLESRQIFHHQNIIQRNIPYGHNKHAQRDSVDRVPSVSIILYYKWSKRRAYRLTTYYYYYYYYYPNRFQKKNITVTFR